MMKILIADADIKNRNQLESAVQKAKPDAQVSLVDTGRYLVSKLNDQQWDAVFIDTVLPQTDAKKLKDILGLVAVSNKTRIVLTSGKIRSNWVSIASCLHAYEFALKPYQPDKIESLLDSTEAINCRKNILMIESSDQLRNIYKNIINNSAIDANLVESASVRRALEILSKDKFDVVILSKNINDMPALEAACQISSNYKDDLPIIFIDNKNTAERQHLQDLGIHSIIQQKFTSFDVNIAIHEALGIWRPYLYNAIKNENT